MATGQGSPLTPELARALAPVAHSIVEPLRQYGAYAQALEPSAGADDEALLCYLGRRPAWTARPWPDADHAGVGSRVGELHHVALAAAGPGQEVALAAAGPEQKVVVGLAGQPGEFAGQAVARPDRFGRLGCGHRRGRREPGIVHRCYTICQ